MNVIIPENICRFIPSSRTGDEICTSDFVFETSPVYFSEYRTVPIYRVYYIVSGSVNVKTVYQDETLSAGDLFFALPAQKFAFPSGEGLTYLYIGYHGVSANRLTEEIGATFGNCVFRGYGELGDPLLGAIKISTASSAGILAESCLLRVIGTILAREDRSERRAPSTDPVTQVRKYVEDHYRDPGLRVSEIAAALSYNQNYLSTVFKRETGFTVGQYILSVRIQNACALASSGVSSVSDIAGMTGFSDPQYFSRVFTSYMQISPKQFMKTCVTKETDRKE